MIDAIKERVSVRSFQKRGLTEKDYQVIKDVLKRGESQVGPFNHQGTFFIKKNNTNKTGKIGTYGFIKNPPAFIGGVIENTQKGMIDFGYVFEHIILELTKHNLGTVWLGGTFHREDFDVSTEKNQIIPAVSPVGYPTNKSLRERLIRRVSNADNRNPFTELFFEGETLEPITQSHNYAHYLEAIQRAPSASNKQPWRVVVVEDKFHFYLERTQGYGKNLAVDIQAIDIGIALAHLQLGLNADNYATKFHHKKPFDIPKWEYILSLSIEK